MLFSDPLRKINSLNKLKTSYEYEPSDSDLMYGPSNGDRRINDDLSNTLNDMKEDRYSDRYNSDRNQIRYGYPTTTTSSSIENR